MPGMNWSDPQTFWLNAANLGLGVVTLICLAVLGYGVVKDMLDRGRRRRAVGRALEREAHGAAAGFGNQVFQVSGLGPTMADGGEPMAQAPKGADKSPRMPRGR